MSIASHPYICSCTGTTCGSRSFIPWLYRAPPGAATANASRHLHNDTVICSLVFPHILLPPLLRSLFYNSWTMLWKLLSHISRPTKWPLCSSLYLDRSSDCPICDRSRISYFSMPWSEPDVDANAPRPFGLSKSIQNDYIIIAYSVLRCTSIRIDGPARCHATCANVAWATLWSHAQLPPDDQGI